MRQEVSSQDIDQRFNVIPKVILNFHHNNKTLQYDKQNKNIPISLGIVNIRFPILVINIRVKMYNLRLYLLVQCLVLAISVVEYHFKLVYETVLRRYLPVLVYCYE